MSHYAPSSATRVCSTLPAVDAAPGLYEKPCVGLTSKLLVALVASISICSSATAAAQGVLGTGTAISRADAIRTALDRSPRAALARADAAAAAASLALARQFENPTLSASYSKSEPQAHFSLDVPIDFPNLRRVRIAAAETSRGATALRGTYARRALELDVDTAYTRAQSAAARALLSARTAHDADSLLSIARVRRDAGDASDLDVELATVFAGQSRNTAANDSLAILASLSLLQAFIGFAADSVSIVLSEVIAVNDSSIQSAVAGRTALPGAIAPVGAGTALPVAVAEREAQAANYRVLVEQRRRLAAPSLSVGFEATDASTKGLLPTFGIALPLPLFNRNAATIQSATAELARAQTSLIVARLEQATAVANAVRTASAAESRLVRSQQLVASANRIAALSLIAYREGAAPLSTALDAQRSARESLSQYVDDVAAARIAASVLRFLSLSSVSAQ